MRPAEAAQTCSQKTTDGYYCQPNEPGLDPPCVSRSYTIRRMPVIWQKSGPHAQRQEDE
jgi:hypothetical protein